MQTDTKIGTFCETLLHDPDRLPVVGFMCVSHVVTRPTVAHAHTLGADLHDLHDLRSRSLLFVHNLVESLRASGVSPPLVFRRASVANCTC